MEGEPNKFLALMRMPQRRGGWGGGWWTTKALTYLEFSKIVGALFWKVWLNHSWSDHVHFLLCNFTVNWPKVFKEVEASLKRSSGICTQGRRQEDLRSVLWSLKDIFQQSILRTSLQLNKPFSKTNVYVPREAIYILKSFPSQEPPISPEFVV